MQRIFSDTEILLVNHQVALETVDYLRKKEIAFPHPITCGQVFVVELIIPIESFNSMVRFRIKFPKDDELSTKCSCILYPNSEVSNASIRLHMLGNLFDKLLVSPAVEEMYLQKETESVLLRRGDGFVSTLLLSISLIHKH